MTQTRLSWRTPKVRRAVLGTAAVALFAGAVFAAANSTALAQSDPDPSASPSAQSVPLRPAPKTHHAPQVPVDSQSTTAPGASTPPAAPVPAGKFRAATRGAVANSYIVVLKNSKATATEVSTSAGTLTKAHHGTVGQLYSRTVRGFSATMTEADAKQLAADPNVAYVEQNQLVHKADVQNTKGSSYDGYNLWALDRIDQPFLPLDHQYTNAIDTQDVHVYVIDTGVNPNHTDFVNNPGFQSGWSAPYTSDQVTTCGPTPANGNDDNGHGTFVAAEVAGYTFGVAKHAAIESVKVLDCNGEGTVAEVVSGIEHVTATAVKPAVANMSIEGAASQTIDDAVNASIAAGVTYAVAAGNHNTDACTESPARVPDAITVGATDTTDFRASFSNWGSCVDIFAPGVNVESAYLLGTNGQPSNAGYAYAGGTSMATPLVAGDAALLLHAHPTWTPAQVRAAIVATGITGTVHGAGAGSTTKLLRTGEPASPTTFALRSRANNLIVTADSGGAAPLVANRFNVGTWEGITVVDAGDGTHVALVSGANGKYVTADQAGAAPLIANRTAIGSWEKFTLIPNADGSVSLQAAVNGKYVTADRAGAGPLIASRTAIDSWEKFDLAGPAATIFVVALANDRVVTADQAGAAPLIANRTAIGGWEQFDVVDAGGYAAFVAHANQRLVTADQAGAAPLIANRTAIGGWEQFTLVNNVDGTVSFLAHADGKWVTADRAGGAPLIASRTAIGTWEEFALFTTDELS